MNIMNRLESLESRIRFQERLESGGASLVACRVYHNANQSIPNGSFTTLAFNSEDYDTDTLHDTSTNNSRLTADRDGYWLIFLHVSFDSNATGDRLVRITENGTNDIASIQVRASPGVTTDISLSTVYHLASTEYVEARVNQNSGGALNVSYTAERSPYFGMSYLGG
jgi:hypothetical protein